MGLKLHNFFLESSKKNLTWVTASECRVSVLHDNGDFIWCIKSFLLLNLFWIHFLFGGLESFKLLWGLWTNFNKKNLPLNWGLCSIWFIGGRWGVVGGIRRSVHPFLLKLKCNYTIVIDAQNCTNTRIQRKWQHTRRKQKATQRQPKTR